LTGVTAESSRRTLTARERTGRGNREQLNAILRPIFAWILASDNASFVHGSAYTVGAGWTLP
jgi:hypothetical protein